MQSSEWTADRLQSRIRDRLRWMATVGTAEVPPIRRECRVHRWHRLETALRNCVLAMPHGGPQLLRFLRRVKARLRRKSSSPGL